MKINQSELRSFFYGTLLGDSYIHNGIFYCKQISKDLILFKQKIINQCLPDAQCTVKEHEAYIDKNGVHHQKFWWLTAHGEYIKKLEKLFYSEGKKVIPKGIISKLTPLGLAIWYADDGTTILVGKNPNTQGANSRRIQLCTDCFSLEELNQAIQEFNSLGYQISLLHRKDQMYRIQFSVMEGQKFICNIADYFYNYFPSLLYKMDLGYRNESLKKRKYVSEEYERLYTKISACPDFLDRLKNR